MSGSMRTAKHKAALRAHEFAATTNTSASAIGHVAHPRGRRDSFRPRRRTNSQRARNPGMQALFLGFFARGGDSCCGAALDSHVEKEHGVAVSRELLDGLAHH